MKSGVVILFGRPNVGKSTFLNSILGDEISIVTPKAQTTRDQIRGIYNSDQGQIVFVDTPGVHRAKEGGINEYMMKEVRRALDGPDLVIYLLDPGSKRDAESVALTILNETSAPVLMVVNKVDLKKRHADNFKWIPDWTAELERELNLKKPRFLGVHEICARDGLGVPELLKKIYETLPDGPKLYEDEDSLTDRPMRFIAAELIRKQLFLNLGDEIPYSTAVEIEQFKETQKPVLISAMIYVERDSQKGMVIGAGGKKIKEIGTKARAEIEKLMGVKIFLELRVKVLENWSGEKRKLKGLGFDV